MYGVLLDGKVSEYVVCMIVMKSVIDNVMEVIDLFIFLFNCVC